MTTVRAALPLAADAQLTPDNLVRQIVDRWRLEHADIPIDMAQFGGLLVYAVETAVEVERWAILRDLDPGKWVYDDTDQGPYRNGFIDALRQAYNRVADRIENGKRAVT